MRQAGMLLWAYVAVSPLAQGRALAAAVVTSHGEGPHTHGTAHVSSAFEDGRCTAQTAPCTTARTATAHGAHTQQYVSTPTRPRDAPRPLADAREVCPGPRRHRGGRCARARHRSVADAC